MAKRRRRWRNVIGLAGARVVLRDARAEVVCRCGELVVLGVWDAVEKCPKCGRWYSLVCVVRQEAVDE